jgi:hypothetical protein
MEHYCLKLETRRVLESLQTVRNKQERLPLSKGDSSPRGMSGGAHGGCLADAVLQARVLCAGMICSRSTLSRGSILQHSLSVVWTRSGAYNPFGGYAALRALALSVFKQWRCQRRFGKDQPTLDKRFDQIGCDTIVPFNINFN